MIRGCSFKALCEIISTVHLVFIICVPTQSTNEYDAVDIACCFRACECCKRLLFYCSVWHIVYFFFNP
ncbi:hypothetical protein RIF29_11718 [Crotalaria pallida]|uniref:Uncharacterized protein n=1 Tax=Crotalaria pallida TaxID=3830 RepID=A0AAN9P096_CROPI